MIENRPRLWKTPRGSFSVKNPKIIADRAGFQHQRSSAGTVFPLPPLPPPPSPANIHTSNNHGLMALSARIYSKCTGARRSMGICTHIDRWCIDNGEWALLGDPTRYYRANKHAVCPPLSPLDTVGITHPPRSICSIRRAVSAPAVCRRASLLTPRLYPISSRPLSPRRCRRRAWYR